MQSDWHKFISLLSERKMSVESQADEWRVISQQTSIIAKNLSSVESKLSEIGAAAKDTPPQSPSQKIREKVEKVRQLSEKCRCIKLDIDTIQHNVVETCSAGVHHPEWLQLLEAHQKLSGQIKDSLSDSEACLQSYKLYKAHKAELELFLQRCKDKVQTVEQR